VKQDWQRLPKVGQRKEKYFEELAAGGQCHFATCAIRIDQFILCRSRRVPEFLVVSVLLCRTICIFI